MDNLIHQYQNLKSWQFDTKVIIFIKFFSEKCPYERLLQSFSNFGMFNVAILQRNHSDFVFIYHNPFLAGESAMTYLWNPQDWTEAFPNKLQDLHGHKLNLVAVNKAPCVINSGESVLGVRACISEAIMKKWNATFSIKIVEQPLLLKKLSAMEDLFINRYPFYSPIHAGYDIVPANYQDQIRIMVRYRKPAATYGFFVKYLSNKFRMALNVSFLMFIILYYILFKRKRRQLHMTIWRLYPITLRQPSFIKLQTCKERIFYAASLWFVFFTAAAYECQFTSFLVAYRPEPKIQSISELTERHVKIYCDRFVFNLLHKDHYNLSSAFLDKLQMVDDIAWNPWNRGPEYAYVISMRNNEFFLKSALNIDPYGNTRFYLMDHIIATIPMVYPFLGHSPYMSEYTRIHDRIVEAGLEHYCLTTTLRKDVWKSWSNFREFEGHTIRQYNQIAVGGCLLVLGWFLSLVCISVEISIKMCQGLNRKKIRLSLQKIFNYLKIKFVKVPKKLKNSKKKRKLQEKTKKSNKNNVVILIMQNKV